jgi:hypothetical protein
MRVALVRNKLSGETCQAGEECDDETTRIGARVTKQVWSSARGVYNSYGHEID